MGKTVKLSSSPGFEGPNNQLPLSKRQTIWKSWDLEAFDFQQKRSSFRAELHPKKPVALPHVSPNKLTIKC